MCFFRPLSFRSQSANPVCVVSTDLDPAIKVYRIGTCSFVYVSF